MKRKITRLAVAAKCGRLTASGSTPSRAVASALDTESSARSAVRASAPNPPPERRSRSRRVSGPELVAVNRRAADISAPVLSIDIQELVCAQDQMTIANPVLGGGNVGSGRNQRSAIVPIRAQNLQCHFRLRRQRQPPERDLVQSPNPVLLRAG